jgi:ribonucleoside-diphosphate reductase alpha chain
MSSDDNMSNAKLNVTTSISIQEGLKVSNNGMRVQKRGARGYEPVKFDKITTRIMKLCDRLEVDPSLVALQTIKNLYDRITTEELDVIASSIAESYKMTHPDYAILASQLLISNLHKTTPKTFSACMSKVSLHIDNLSDRHLEFIRQHADTLDNMIVNADDFQFTYMGFKTLEKSYLIKIKESVLGTDGKPIYLTRDRKPILTPILTTSTGRVVTTVDGKVIALVPQVADRIMDRPQYMYMRVAIAIGIDCDLPLEVIKTYYKALSNQQFIFATPSNFNACFKHQQMNSCFLLNTGDSIEDIMKTVTNTAYISKRAGGIGIAMHKIRPNGAEIKGTNGQSSGLVRQIKIYNANARCWNQGGKRKGAFAIYVALHHGDIMAVLKLKLQQGLDDERARDLFYATWVPDLFHRRYAQYMAGDKTIYWSLFGDDTAPGLSEVFDGMQVCTICNRCENIDYQSLVSRGIINVKDCTTCQHDYQPKNVYTMLYEYYEREGLAVQTICPADIVDAICEAHRESGTPYVCNKDHANRQTNQQNIGTLQLSNLCVVPETYVLTSTGQRKISDIVDVPTSVWNGVEFTETVPRKTGIAKKIIRVNLSNGVHIDCTEAHKFYIHGKNQPIDASKLQVGDKLIKYKLPVINEGSHFPYAYTHGLFCADGTYEKGNGLEKPCDYKSINGGSFCARHISFATGLEDPSDECQGISNTEHPRITLYDHKRLLDRFLETRVDSTAIANKIEARPHLDILPKFTVPMDACLLDKLDWFAGYCDGDGTISKNGDNYALQASSIHNQFLLNIRLMLQTIGVDSKVTMMRDATQNNLPDGKGGHKLYNCKPLYRLLISSVELARLHDLGLDCNRLTFPYQTPQRDASAFIRVVSIEDHGRISDTYCFTELNRGMGMFNGVLTGQCTEIYEWNSKDSYACCTLSSINLKKYLMSVGEKYIIDHSNLHSAVRLIVRGLDNIIDANVYPISECEDNASKYRPIGIGVQALADVFLKMRIPFLSAEAAQIDLEIFETIYHAALEATIELARERGQYSAFNGSPASKGILRFDLWNRNQDVLKSYGVNNGLNRELLSNRYDWSATRIEIMEHGMRNSLLVALMPTVSTSQILGNNEAFEPIPSNIYTKSTLAGKFTVINDYMIRHLIELGLWSEDMKNRIMNNGGSVQNIDELPTDVKEIYKTVWEMKQTDIMSRAAIRQAFVDQGQSLNIHVSDNSNSTLRGIMVFGWELGLPTGSYYIRTKAAGKALNNNLKAVELKSTEPTVAAAMTKEAMMQWNVVSESADTCDPGCDSCGS